MLDGSSYGFWALTCAHIDRFFNTRLIRCSCVVGVEDLFGDLQGEVKLTSGTYKGAPIRSSCKLPLYGALVMGSENEPYKGPLIHVFVCGFYNSLICMLFPKSSETSIKQFIDKHSQPTKDAKHTHGHHNTTTSQEPSDNIPQASANELSPNERPLEGTLIKGIL